MTGERFTLDTNVLVYSIDSVAGLRHEVARQVVDLASQGDCVLTLQAVSEFFVVATRKRMMPRPEAAAHIIDWLEAFPSVAHSATAVRVALAAAASGHASYWDALLLATAAEGGCDIVLSEDMADGSVVSGVCVVNPFGPQGMTASAARLLT